MLYCKLKSSAVDFKGFPVTGHVKCSYLLCVVRLPHLPDAFEKKSKHLIQIRIAHVAFKSI